MSATCCECGGLPTVNGRREPLRGDQLFAEGPSRQPVLEYGEDMQEKYDSQATGHGDSAFQPEFGQQALNWELEVHK